MRLIDADKGLVSKIQLKTGCSFTTAQEIVDSIPTAEERKVGKWIYMDTCYECSICQHGEGLQSSFCPNCGADMRGNVDE